MKNFFTPITNLFTSTKAEISTNDTASIRRFFGGEASINGNNAIKIATVFSCVNIKANALAVIPIKTYKIGENGKEEY